MTRLDSSFESAERQVVTAGEEETAAVVPSKETTACLATQPPAEAGWMGEVGRRASVVWVGDAGVFSSECGLSAALGAVPWLWRVLHPLACFRAELA